MIPIAKLVAHNRCYVSKKPIHGKSKNKSPMKKKVKELKSPYYTNNLVRSKIDELLHENCVIWSNLGTGTTLDSKSREEGEKYWAKIAKEIKSLDEAFFNTVCPHGIDS